MKKLQYLLATAALMALLIGCKKVEVVPGTQQVMLPLAVGNQWVYVDSFITSTTLPTADTVVKVIRYEVTRRKLTDNTTWHGGSDNSVKRYEAWEVKNSYVDYSPLTMIVRDDTVYASQYFFTLFERTDLNCNRVAINLLASPNPMYTPAGSMLAVMTNPRADLGRNELAPVFHDLPECMPELGPDGYEGIKFTIFYDAIIPVAAPVPVTTPAGTFSCIDFGSQQWGYNVGLVQSYHEGEAAFYDHNHQLQTGLLRWKRTLLSYQVN